MATTTIAKDQRRTPRPGQTEIMFVEIRGDAPADLGTLASAGTCRACKLGTCQPVPAYLRISKDKFAPDATLEALQADRGVVRQAQAMIRLVASETSHVILFVDNDTKASVKRKDVAQWWRALEYVQTENPAKLLGLKHDRLGRRMADLEDLDDICTARGNDTRVITLADGDLFSNPAWPFMSAMAKTEARNISWRVRQAQDSRRAKGLDAVGGNRPFGYAADRMTVIPHEKDTILEMIRLFLDERMSGTALAEKLNGEGVRRAEGGTWNSARVRDTLANPRYAGLRTEAGTVVGKGAWPAFITETVHEQIKARLESTNNRGKGGRAVATLLGGIARCGYCETPLHGAVAGSNSRLTYKCPKQSGGCGAVNRTRATIDNYVIERALALVNASVAANEALTVRERLDSLQQARTDLDVRAEANRAEYASGRLDAAGYYAARDAIAADSRKLDKEMQEALAELDGLSAEGTAREMWDSWSIDKRRQFIASKLAAVLIFKAKTSGRAARVVQAGEIEIVPA